MNRKKLHHKHTFVQATNCEVVSAHVVAALMTFDWWGDSTVAATFLALTTRAAVVLATALAKLSKISRDSSAPSSPICVRTCCEASPTLLAAFNRFWRP